MQASQAMDSRRDEIANQIRMTARALCRDLRENPVAVEVLYHNGTTAHGRSKDLQMLVKTLSELTDLTRAKLDKTLEDALSKKELMVAAENRLKQADDERSAIREKLKELQKTKEEEVAVLDAQVQKLRIELQRIDQNASLELAMIDAEVKEAQAKAYDLHSEEIKELFNQVSALEKRAVTMAQEHQEKEEILRKKKSKMAAEVAAAVEKHDSELESLSAEQVMLKETLRNEREQCERLSEYFLKIDEEQYRIAAEEQILAEIRALEHEKQMKIFNAATKIQKVYRGILCRREYTKMVNKSKKGKKGKKGSKKGKKK